MAVANINATNTEEAAHLLSSIVRATACADQDAGSVQATSEWLALIEAAAKRAHCLLTGSEIEQEA